MVVIEEAKKGSFILARRQHRVDKEGGAEGSGKESLGAKEGGREISK